METTETETPRPESVRSRVLYSTYSYAFQIFGGAEIQMLKTKEYIEKAGRWKVKLFNMFSDKLEQYDILHVFSMHQDSLLLYRKAKDAGLKLVLSPIYWDLITRRMSRIIGPSSFIRFYSNLKSYRVPTFRQMYPFKDFLDLADVILPTSKMEADSLSRNFKVSSEKFQVVPNAVEQRFASADPTMFVQKHGIKDFVLYVGRIERLKNPLGLIQTCRDLDIPFVIIGAPNIGDREYFEECMREVHSSPKDRMIGFLPHNSEELSSAYAAAKVFALASDHETPSLAALEAGLAGCNVVITVRGSTREYFGDHALYVNPTSKEDIKEKILEAYEKPKNDGLKRYILKNYTWERTAEKTVRAYERVLSGS
jgi:glycosyltransferase involved in cell wall biosynthesis